MKKIIAILSFGFILAACGESTPEQTPAQGQTVGMANPASTNCVNMGGTLEIKTQEDGGQYGVCSFPDGKQCEEWAMMRGACPVRGVDISPYNGNEVQIFCAIRGGVVNAEKGICIIGEQECEINSYFKGICKKDMNIIAKKHCNDPEVQTVFACDNYYGVMFERDGAGIMYFDENGNSFTCPVVAPEDMSVDCKKILDDTSCERKNICPEKVAQKPTVEVTVFDKFAAEYKIGFGAITTTEMDWRDANNNVTKMSAKEVDVPAINQSPDLFSAFFLKNGFENSEANAADGVGESLQGFTSNDFNCLANIQIDTTNYTVKSAKISCAQK